MSQVADQMLQGDAKGAQELLALSMVAIEQVAQDNGGCCLKKTPGRGFSNAELPRPIRGSEVLPSLPAGLGGNSAELRRGDRHSLLQEAGGFQRSRTQKLPKGSQRQKGPKVCQEAKAGRPASRSRMTGGCSNAKLPGVKFHPAKACPKTFARPGGSHSVWESSQVFSASPCPQFADCLC